MSKALKIKNFPEYYITDKGDVYSIKQGRFVRLKPDNSRGYNRITIKGSRYMIHRLVADAFIPNPTNRPQVNHINGIRNDNRVENLEWVTQSENMLHAYKVLGRKGSMTGKFGKDNHKSKAVVQISGNKIIRKFFGVREAQRKTGVLHIADCCRGERLTAGGYRWKYSN